MPRKSVKKDNDFELVNLPKEAQDPSITAEDFKPVTVDKGSHEQRFQTKPTTFLKDSIKRFGKNKSSVVAAVILGILLVMAFAVPAIESDVTQNMRAYSTYLEPKLFDTGTGWWDGTKKYTDIPAAEIQDEQGSRWIPDPSTFKENAIVGGITVDSGVKYRDTANKYAKGGSVKFTVNEYSPTTEPYIRTNKFLYFTNIPKLVVDDKAFVYYDLDSNDISVTFEIANNDYSGEEYPTNHFHDFNLVFFYDKLVNEDTKEYGETMVYIEKDIPKTSTTVTVDNISSILKEQIKDTSNLRNPRFGFTIKNDDNAEYILLIKSLTFNTDQVSDENLKFALTNVSFTDANECMLRENNVYYPTSIDKDAELVKCVNPARWSSNSEINLYRASYKACSFTYDTYEAKLGLMKNYSLGKDVLQRYVNDKYIRVLNDDGLDIPSTVKYLDIEVINKERCPIISSGEYRVKNYDKQTETYEIEADILLYKYYGYVNMPKFMFGTDANGNNMNKYVFEGLRNSLLLGIITSAICFVFGLIWGAICGYFGGATDLIMERFTDILSGVPWIVVMTLCIIKLGQSMLVFGLALCLTGWIGTAATTRTQFYRFKNREYVLASRTLGASDARLIAKHVLPNAMGTIITGAVLMIPSVIFSEATISYLGLGLKGMSSLGVILSDNQKEILTNPYLLLFPSVVIALIMISFNLFGNGLRDAINPSLKGEEE